MSITRSLSRCACAFSRWLPRQGGCGSRPRQGDGCSCFRVQKWPDHGCGLLRNKRTPTGKRFLRSRSMESNGSSELPDERTRRGQRHVHRSRSVSLFRQRTRLSVRVRCRLGCLGRYRTIFQPRRRVWEKPIVEHRFDAGRTYQVLTRVTDCTTESLASRASSRLRLRGAVALGKCEMRPVGGGLYFPIDDLCPGLHV